MDHDQHHNEPEGLPSLSQLGNPVEVNLDDWTGKNTISYIDQILDSMDQQEPAEPFLEITEQPKPKDHRFRYPCEGPRAGAILGVKSTARKKTSPEVRINNLAGKAIIIGSLVTKDGDKPHPFKLVGDNCDSGIVKREVDSRNPTVKFESLGIQCVTKKELKTSLLIRKKLCIDPFANIDQVLQEDLQELECKVVRICFQAFLEDPNTPGRYIKGLKPVLSNPVYNKKDTNLKIMRMNRDFGVAKGNDEMYLFCEKVDKDDIQVEFYQEGEAGVIWRGYGSFGTADVHHQIAIVLRTPSYQTPKIDHAIEVKISLRRPSDEDRSEPKNFTYIPEDEDAEGISAKRKRKHSNSEAALGVKDEPGTSGISKSEQVRRKLRAKLTRNKKPAVGSSPAQEQQNVDPFSFQSVSNPDTRIMVQSENSIGHVTVKDESPKSDYSLPLPPELFSPSDPGYNPSESDNNSVEFDFSPMSQQGETLDLNKEDIPIVLLNPGEVDNSGSDNAATSFGDGTQLSAGQLAAIFQDISYEGGIQGNMGDPYLSQHNMVIQANEQPLPNMGSFLMPMEHQQIQQVHQAEGDSPGMMDTLETLEVHPDTNPF